MNFWQTALPDDRLSVVRRAAAIQFEKASTVADRIRHITRNQIMSSMNRRHFLEDSMLAAAAAAATIGNAAPLLADESKPITSPNEKLRGVIIGCHGRGGEHIAQLIGRKDIEIAYVCDVNSKVGNSRCEQIDKALNGHKPKYAQDLRRALDDKSVDFVTIATPNHWHSLAAIWAMQAGKDVYVEKPVSHNVSEGRRAVQTAARHKRICQTGMQSRSSEGMQEAMVYLRAGQARRGEAGPRTVLQTACVDRSEGRLSAAEGSRLRLVERARPDFAADPAEISLRLALAMALRQRRHRQSGRASNGHRPLGAGHRRLANSVITYGGRFGYEDAADTPNTEVSIYEFGPDATMVFEVRGLKTQDLLGERIGTILYGSEGYMASPDLSSGSTIRTASVFDLKGKLVQSFGKGFDPLADHFSNFFNAIRSRKPEELTAPILDGHLSAALCHQGNISYRLGSPHTDGEALDKLKSLKTNEHAKETLDRVISHLSDNSVRLGGKTELRLGPQLQFDPKAETFIDNPAADAMLTRDYRAPFVVPAAENV